MACGGFLSLSEDDGSEVFPPPGSATGADGSANNNNNSGNVTVDGSADGGGVVTPGDLDASDASDAPTPDNPNPDNSLNLSCRPNPAKTGFGTVMQCEAALNANGCFEIVTPPPQDGGCVIAGGMQLYCEPCGIDGLGYAFVDWTCTCR